MSVYQNYEDKSPESVEMARILIVFRGNDGNLKRIFISDDEIYVPFHSTQML